MMIIKLGSTVEDKVTELIGTITHLQIEMGLAQWYAFQPRGLNPENGLPIESFWIPPARLLVNTSQMIPPPDLHLEVLGTIVKDEASGFKGTAIFLTLHMNGCVHFNVQPNGALPQTGARFKDCNFDIRRLKGDAIRPMQDSDARPSPEPISSHEPDSI